MTESSVSAPRRNPLGAFLGGLICGWITIAVVGVAALAVLYVLQSADRAIQEATVATFQGQVQGRSRAARVVIELPRSRVLETCAGACDDILLEGERPIFARVEDADGGCLACGNPGLFGVGADVGPMTLAKRR